MSDKEEEETGSLHSHSMSPGEKTPEAASEKSGSAAAQESPKKSPSGSPSPGHESKASRQRSASRSRSGSRSRSFRRYRSRSYSRSPRKYRSRSRSRRRYYSRSRSRSPYSRRRRSRNSRGRSRSNSPYYRGRRYNGYRSNRSHSTSPMSGRRRHVGNRDNPKTSRCLGVFGLSLYTQERDLREIFGRYGPVEEVQVVYDHQTGRSRGFAFIYMRNPDDAQEARERAPGMEIDGRKIRVDFSITERAHTPTPGIYLGKPTPGYRSSGSGRRSASPYYGKGRRYSRSRSRSRSYSPRGGRY